MFPLNVVLFPGVSVPLHVFEDRYRALVHHLLRVPDPTDRVFGSVAIREGYEVGDHGAQSLFRVGCRVQLTDVESQADGTFDLVAVGLDRIELERLDTSGPFPLGDVLERPEQGHRCPRNSSSGPAHVLGVPRRAGGIRGTPTRPSPEGPDVPVLDPGRGRAAPPARPAGAARGGGPVDRLILVTDLLRTELRAMNVIPSLPATEVARTRWSPN